MPDKPKHHSDPDANLRRLRTRVLGGARPPLDSLGVDEMVAANEMINRGEAMIDCYACRLFLVAKFRDGSLAVIAESASWPSANSRIAEVRWKRPVNSESGRNRRSIQSRISRQCDFY